MKLNSVLFGQIIRTMKLSEPAGGLYGIKLVRACEERYGFLQGPRTISEFDLTKGITFLHGYFEHRFVIDRFQVYNNGLLVEAKVDTDECARFLTDVMAWLTEAAGVSFDEADSRSFYLSHVEAQLDVALADSFPKFRELGQLIANTLRSYGHSLPDLNVSSFALSTGSATTFRIERREGTLPEARTYFCTAPLRTTDQLGLLKIAEKILLST